MMDLIGNVFGFLGMVIKFFFSLVIIPETGVTIGDMLLGGIAIIILFALVLAVVTRITGIGGDKK